MPSSRVHAAEQELDESWRQGVWAQARAPAKGRLLRQWRKLCPLFLPELEAGYQAYKNSTNSLARFQRSVCSVITFMYIADIVFMYVPALTPDHTDEWIGMTLFHFGGVSLIVAMHFGVLCMLMRHQGQRVGDAPFVVLASCSAVIFSLTSDRLLRLLYGMSWAEAMEGLAAKSPAKIAEEWGQRCEAYVFNASTEHTGACGITRNYEMSHALLIVFSFLHACSARVDVGKLFVLAHATAAVYLVARLTLGGIESNAKMHYLDTVVFYAILLAFCFGARTVELRIRRDYLAHRRAAKQHFVLQAEHE